MLPPSRQCQDWIGLQDTQLVFENCLLDSVGKNPHAGGALDMRQRVLCYTMNYALMIHILSWYLGSTVFIIQSILYFILSFILCYHLDTNNFYIRKAWGQREGNKAKPIQPTSSQFSGSLQWGQRKAVVNVSRTWSAQLLSTTCEFSAIKW